MTDSLADMLVQGDNVKPITLSVFTVWLETVTDTAGCRACDRKYIVGACVDMREGINYIVFDIENRQEHYAQCLEFIKAIRIPDKIIAYLEKESEKEEFIKNHTSGYRLPAADSDLAPRSIAARIERRFQNQISKSAKKAIDISKVQKHIPTTKYDFYFRISTSGTDVSEFAYFALMLLHSGYVSKANTLTCLILPKETDKYAYYDFSSTIFGKKYPFIVYTGEEFVTQKSNPETHKLLPMLSINESTFKDLSTEYTLNNSVIEKGRDGTIFEEVMTAITFNTKNDTATAFIRHSNYVLSREVTKRLKKQLTPQNRHIFAKELAAAIVETVNNKNGIAPLHYLIYALQLRHFISEFLQNFTDRNWLRKRVEDCYINSLPFAQGLLQVVENIVFHAESPNSSIQPPGKGLLAARWHDALDGSHKTYVADHLERTGAAFSDEKRMSLPHLELIVADFNEKFSVIDSLLSQDAVDLEFLREKRDHLRFADLMGEYSDSPAKDEWEAFRSSRPAQCQGLLKFAEALQISGTVVNARSSISFDDAEDSTNWNRDFRGKMKASKLSRMEKFYIPGTQYKIIFPVDSKRQKAYPITEALNMSFASFAKHLSFRTYRDVDLSASILDKLGAIEENIHSNSRTPVGEKGFRWAEFKKFWNERYDKVFREHDKKLIYVADVGDAIYSHVGVSEPSVWMESLCKGFLDSKWMSASSELTKVVFVGYNDRFAETLRSTLIVSRRDLTKSNTRVCFANGVWNNGEMDEIGPDTITEAALAISPLPVQSKHTIDNVPWRCFEFGNETSPVLSELKKYADNELRNNSVGPPFGAKLTKTHVKLGNKVHLDTFYEMATHFMKVEVAKDVAFLLIRRLLEEENFQNALRDKDVHICLYGYSAYSRTIVNAAYEILSAMNESYRNRITFVVYQTKQAGRTMDYEEQVYFSDAKIKENKSGKVVVVQIAPIATTLTTFRKMWWELCKTKDWPSQVTAPAHNLSVLWVRNNYNDYETPEGEEKWYWHKVDSIRKTVSSHDDDIIKSPHFLFAAKAGWKNPLLCDKCYPEHLCEEEPIVRTDDSSTVPSQQYYPPPASRSSEYSDTINNSERLALLCRHVKYGHLQRGANHYQFYIDTQNYFRDCRDKIEEWLADCKEQYNDVSGRVLIVTPLKPNNIEFSQCINNSCFGGTALMLHLDSEKHYRSNLKLDFAQYIEEINAAREDESPYVIVYADVAIASGQTFQRIASLMNTIASDGKKAFVFDGAFLLVDRLSRETKASYISPSTDKSDDNSRFLSFVRLNISNMRTYGDSCVGCKLREEAERYFELSATKSLSEYWQGKIIKNDIVFHEDWCTAGNKATEDRYKAKAFLRLLCTHDAMDRLGNVRGKLPADYFALLNEMVCKSLDIAADGRHAVDYYPFHNIISMEKLQSDAKETIIVSLIKALSRPFFSYDFTLKSALAKILMCTTMLVLEKFNVSVALQTLGIKNQEDSSQRKYVENASKKLSKSIKNFYNALSDKKKAKFLFVLLKALTDMQMNFILRKPVAIKIFSFLMPMPQDVKKDFYKRYAKYVLRAVNYKGDSGKAYRLEILLATGEDLTVSMDEKSISYMSIDDVAAQFGVPAQEKYGFHAIRKLLVIENNHILFEGVEELSKRDVNMEILKETHMWDLARFVLLESSGKIDLNGRNAAKSVLQNSAVVDLLKHTLELYKLLESDASGTAGNSEQSAESRYKSLCSALQNIAKAYLGECKVSIVAKYRAENNKLSEYLNIFKGNYFIVAAKGDDTKDEEFFLQEQANFLNTKLPGFLEEQDMQEYGFFVDGEVACMEITDNITGLRNMFSREKYPHVLRRSFADTQSVYILVESATLKDDEYLTLRLMRGILVYRHLLVKWLEKDFSNDNMSYIAWLRRVSKLLSAQKVVNHARDDDMKSFQLAVSRDPFPNTGSKQQNFVDSEFHLQQKLRGDHDRNMYVQMIYQYANIVIARLYRGMIESYMLNTDANEDALKDFYAIPDARLSSGVFATLEYKQKLTALSELFHFVVYKNEQMVEMSNGTTQLVDILGVSRKRWLRAMLDAIELHIDDMPVTTENFESLAKHYEFIEFPIDGARYKMGYCSENFACFLLDFFFSAMKHSTSWDSIDDSEQEVGDYGTDPVYRFNYFARRRKQSIKILRGSAVFDSTPESYEWMIIQAKTNKEEGSERKSNPDGMSVPTWKWYTDSLWTLAFPSIDSKNLPKAEERKSEDLFEIRLPILKPKIQEGVQ